MDKTDNEEKEALNTEAQSSLNTLDLDTILLQEVGQFGWYQVRNILLSLIVVIFIGWSTNSYIFTTARIPTRCYIPECDLFETEFAPDWLLNAVPGTSLSSFDNCHRFSKESRVNRDETPTNTECSVTWFNQTQLKSCDRHIYQNTHTVVYDFDLGCDEWRRTSVGSSRFLGTLFTQLLTGLISDRWGRRTALVFNCINCAWLGIVKSFANTYICFTILEFAQALLGGGSFQCAYILLVEMVGSKNRVLTSTFLNTTLSISMSTLGLVAWAVPNWRLLSLALFAPQLFTISYIWLMGESVRWYISKRRYKDCERTLKDIARANKRHLSDRSLQIITNMAEGGKNEEAKVRLNKHKSDESSLIVLLFKHRTVLLRCLITPVLWITLSFIYKGLIINAVEISGNKYVNYIVVVSAQIPGFWIAYFLLDKFGRKPILTASYWVCAVCQTGYIFIPKNQYLLSMALYLIGTSCSAIMFAGLYIYVAELYPTPYRHRLFAFSCMVGRCGAVISPLTPALGALVWDKLPFVLFAGCAYVAGGLVLLLPETRGTRLPDTMQEAADLGKRQKRRTGT